MDFTEKIPRFKGQGLPRVPLKLYIYGSKI